MCLHACSTLYASAAVNRDTRRMKVAVAKTREERGSRASRRRRYAINAAPKTTVHLNTKKNQRNQTKQNRNAKKKTSAQTANKQAALVTPEEKEYRLQKKLCALTQVGVRVLQSLRQSLDARPDTRQRQLL